MNGIEQTVFCEKPYFMAFQLRHSFQSNCWFSLQTQNFKKLLWGAVVLEWITCCANPGLQFDPLLLWSCRWDFNPRSHLSMTCWWAIEFKFTHSFKNCFIQALSLFIMWRLEGEQCRFRWGGSSWATSSEPTLFVKSVIFRYKRVFIAHNLSVPNSWCDLNTVEKDVKLQVIHLFSYQCLKLKWLSKILTAFHYHSPDVLEKLLKRM